MFLMDEEKWRRLAAEFGFPCEPLPARVATSPEKVITYLVDKLAVAGTIAHEVLPEVTRNLLRREQLGSTGVGRGVALPHAYDPHVDAPVGVFAFTNAGVPWDAIDGDPVFWIVLYLEHAPRSLRFCETLVRQLRA